MIEQQKREVQHQTNRVGSSFSSFNAFLKNLESLDEAFNYIRGGLKNDQEFAKSTKASEADKILEELGCVDVVTRQDAGNNFYRQVAQQIDAIFSKLLPKKGGVMSLIDIYLYYNRMRGSDLVTTTDLLQAAKELRRIQSALELRELPNGLKIIQLKT
jgi:ESCRT-II complex subunit VPS36